jgi:hypothetical protein
MRPGCGLDAAWMRPGCVEQEAEENCGVLQVLADHLAKVYKVNLPAEA